MAFLAARIGLILGAGAAFLLLLTTIFSTSAIAIIVQRHSHKDLPLWLQSTLCLAAATTATGITGIVAAVVVGFTQKKQTFLVTGFLSLFAGTTAAIATGVWCALRGEFQMEAQYDRGGTLDGTLGCTIVAMICSVMAAVVAFVGLVFPANKEVPDYPQMGYYHRRNSDDWRNAVHT